MPKGAKIEADFSGVSEALGHIQGASKEINSGYYASSIVERTHAEAAREFNRIMAAEAGSNPKMFHHVYEWGKTGVQAAALWSHDLRGHGRSGVRTATFHFINSKTPVPQPKTMPGSSGKTTNSSKKYIFAAKATIMEYGIPVTIKSRTPGGLIFIPGADKEDWHGQGYIFARQAEVKNPGGAVSGKFTAAWSNYWNGMGHTAFERLVAPKVEGRLREIMSPRTRHSTTSVNKGKMGLRTIALSSQAESQAAAAVRMEAQRLEREAQTLRRSLNGRQE